MAGVGWQTFAGRPFLDVDYRDCSPADMLAVARASVTELEQAAQGSLVLVDITDAVLDREWLAYVRVAAGSVMRTTHRVAHASLGTRSSTGRQGRRHERGAQAADGEQRRRDYLHKRPEHHYGKWSGSTSKSSIPTGRWK